MAKKERLLASTMMVTLIIIISKGFGFARDMVTTAYFGLSFSNDAYNSAYSLFYLPVLLFNSCISATLIPLFMEARAQGGKQGADRFASNAISLFAAIALVLTIFFIAFAQPLVRLVYRGFDARKAEATAQLLQIMMLGLVFNITSISVASLLNAAEKYIAAQLTGFPLSFCVILASVCFSEKYGIAAVAWGVFAANVLQLLILLPFLRGWFKFRPALNLKDPVFRRLMVLALPAMLSMGVSELNHMIDHALASSLQEGTLSAMTSAYRLVTFVQGILVVPLTTIMFSKMSRAVAEKDEKKALHMLLHSAVTLIAVICPVVVVGVLGRRDVIIFAYMRGKFTYENVSVTAGVLAFYLVGIPAFALRDFLSRMFHALKNTRAPFRVSCVVVATNIVLNFILRALMGANGLALATSIAGYVGVCILLWLLKKHFGHLGLMRTAKELTKVALATALCLVAGIFVGEAIMKDAVGTWSAFIRLAAMSVTAIGAYVLALLVLRFAPLYDLTKKLLKKGGR